MLPLAQIKSRLFGHSLVSLPFCVYGGIATESEAARRALDAAAQKLAARAAGGAPRISQSAGAARDWQTKDLYVTFRKEILPDEEQNMQAIPRKQRAMVRKGIKFGLQSEIDDNTDRFFAAYSASVHRLGTPVFSRKFFQLLKETFGRGLRSADHHARRTEPSAA